MIKKKKHFASYIIVDYQLKFIVHTPRYVLLAKENHESASTGSARCTRNEERVDYICGYD